MCRLVVLLAVAAAIIGAGHCVRAESGQHGDGHHERHDWYSTLKHPITGYSCCTRLTHRSGDCRPVRAYFDDVKGRWMALIDGRWLEVPSGVVLDPRLNQEPIYAHACISKRGVWYCFLGAGGAR
jgi:hypothetical protein